LLPEPSRRASGYRQYLPDAVARLEFIRHGKELGFTLTEIAELLALRVDPDTSCADVKVRADAKIMDVHEKIRSLLRIEKALTTLAAQCHGQGPTGDCPILDALNGESFDR
ncbi:MAG: MerR family DNA-binding protein, partial [Candidatus Marinimicrobia bacterium]|nr:MerR family DNA-binding protein [Candidatus Neomarinimicrobiota bacterium]